MPEGYDNAKQARRKELEKHWDTIAKVQEGKRFFQRVASTATFNKSEKVYGEDVAIPHRPTSVRVPSKAEHERAFRPSMPIRKGQTTCTLERFPDYKENPPKALQKKPKVEGEIEPPPGFRMTHRKKSRPTPSVALNFRNLKASYPTVFRR